MNPNLRQHLEVSLGRQVRTGSLGSVSVDRTGRSWTVMFRPGFQRELEVERYSNRRRAAAGIRAWVAHRQQLLALDIGTYTLVVPANFGRIDQ